MKAFITEEQLNLVRLYEQLNLSEILSIGEIVESSLPGIDRNLSSKTLKTQSREIRNIETNDKSDHSLSHSMKTHATDIAKAETLEKLYNKPGAWKIGVKDHNTHDGQNGRYTRHGNDIHRHYYDKKGKWQYPVVVVRAKSKDSADKHWSAINKGKSYSSKDYDGKWNTPGKNT
jgi:hypothetical protein